LFTFADVKCRPTAVKMITDTVGRWLTMCGTAFRSISAGQIFGHGKFVGNGLEYEVEKLADA